MEVLPEISHETHNLREKSQRQQWTLLGEQRRKVDLFFFRVFRVFRGRSHTGSDFPGKLLVFIGIRSLPELFPNLEKG